ncbi:MAG: CcmD family protein, partial [Caldilineae bacterium]
MIYMVAAYIVIWLVVFVFVLRMWMRQNQLEEQLTILEEVA